MAELPRWYWKSDSDWILIDPKKALLLETGFKNSTKKVQLDKERFVDLSLGSVEVCKNFVNFPHDNKVIGLQRRYDDETKRRAVKRDTTKSPDPLKGMRFILAKGLVGGKLTSKEKDLCTAVKDLGGKLETTDKVDYIIVTEDLDYPFEKPIVKAQQQEILFVTKKWLDKCSIDGCRIDHSNYLYDFDLRKKEVEKELKKKEKEKKEKEKEKEKEKKEKEEKEKEKEKKEKEKRKSKKKDEEEDDNPQPSKKAKTDADSTTTTTTSTTSTSTSTSTTSTSKVEQ
eukprot:TRINITY_DN2144_c0_g1_i1.p1 TRINITY_DN2144_c0_g1~~TRINITY_DN2144_c0_g1_i1.p1  ORF type:complete len:284 (+),score=86.71 TRINITY_DN2144_c0_g1_i1:44-895(+)